MYKKHKIVLIKSNEDANVGQNNWYLPNSQQLVIDNKLSHLYILSSDIIVKEGEWYISHKVNGIYQASTDICAGSSSTIIATTNNLIGATRINYIRRDNELSISSIPKSFIKYYIKQYNKGIVLEEVKVLFDENNTPNCIDNEIQIDFSDEVYSRCEVKALIEKAIKESQDNNSRMNQYGLDSWFIQNLNNY